MAENGDKTVKDPDTGKFVNYAGPGRPPGRKNDLTIYREALEKLAQLNDKTPEEIDAEIVASGITNARKGNYQYYRDYMDRTRGPVVNKNENVNLNADFHKLQEEDKKRLDDLIK